VTRGINKIDTEIIPKARSGCRGNGNAALLFLLHPVHGGCPIVDLPQLMGNARVIKNPLGGRSFASVDVSHDSNISGLF
jgi:hypothetical protein